MLSCNCGLTSFQLELTLPVFETGKWHYPQQYYSRIQTWSNPLAVWSHQSQPQRPYCWCLTNTWVFKNKLESLRDQDLHKISALHWLIQLNKPILLLLIIVACDFVAPFSSQVMLRLEGGISPPCPPDAATLTLAHVSLLLSMVCLFSSGQIKCWDKECAKIVCKVWRILIERSMQCLPINVIDMPLMIHSIIDDW